MLDLAAWSRGALYTLVGHAAGVTRAVSSAASHKRRRPAGPAPADFSDHQAFKRAATQAAWDARRGAAQHFLQLRASNPGAAERYLSSFFNAQDRFEIALADPATGQALSADAMLQVLAQDLQARANNGFPQDPAAILATTRAASAVHQSGAARAGAQTTRGRRLYTMAELDDVLASFKVTSSALRGCYASVKSACPQGRRLTLALANLSRSCGLTSTCWSERQFTPLHQSGPRLVRAVACLRPISISTVMSAVVDALWTQRNRPTLTRYCGAGQQGGVGNPLLVLLALLLHAQLRGAQALPTYWALTDLQWAFDVASHDALLLSSFLGGVVKDDWLLLDDFIHVDTQFVTPGPRAAAELAGWVSGGPTEADRAPVHVALRTDHLQPLQFSDDLSVAWRSPGALRAVLSAEPDSACSRFARAVRADFNYASGKMAATAVVPLRVEAAILYPYPFVLLAQRAEHELNSMQVDIAHALCGCPGQTRRRAELETRALPPALSQAGAYMHQLFRDGPPPEQRWHHVLFVARALPESIGPDAFCHREAA
ncbi:unnamed protein product [Prorocentrum cordatum]|uniref:Reverse transcriptase domain-containing protein n=1 Tax=Prorocentrum cordatum TaxID=2364126 RepID=A0ABN9Y3K1_9DINO|nr:unnamed protein product [Polarella glacialis]